MAAMRNTLEGRRVLEERAKRGERLSDDEIGAMTKQTAELGGVEEGMYFSFFSFFQTF